MAARAAAPPPQYDHPDKQNYYYASYWGVQEVAGSVPVPHEVDGSEGMRRFELDGGDYGYGRKI